MSFRGYDDLSGFEDKLPHLKWSDSFFNDWTEDKKNFYYEILRHNTLSCSCGMFGSKHIFGNDGNDCTSLMRTVRHDYISDKIVEKVKQAIESKKRGSFFSTANDWKFLERRESRQQHYEWPEEFGKKNEFNLPHTLVYSMTPEKKVMIIENSIMWEEWYKLSPDERKFPTKTEEYESFVDQLEQNGFKVEFRDVELPCRGVPSEALYTLFSEDFKMEEGDISLTMEEISKQFITFAYAFWLSQQAKRKRSELISK